MTTVITELLPAISSLSRSEKFQLVQLVLAQLAQEVDTEDPTEISDATGKKSLRGCLKQYANPELIDQEQDVWPMIASEKHGHR